MMSMRGKLVHRLLRHGPRTKRYMFAATASGVTPEDILQGLHELLKSGVAEMTPEGRFALAVSPPRTDAEASEAQP